MAIRARGKNGWLVLGIGDISGHPGHHMLEGALLQALKKEQKTLAGTLSSYIFFKIK